MLEKIMGILSEEEYLIALETLKTVEEEFEKWEQGITSF
ncbi:hypothetical protein X802_04875 [Thermococcus guaymasensis DSM 11113]|uniref:Uncharacterized protein n=1 Tax=Thermococcus guaymasensis DSM 11113 TaxID=1432656 RepID=A0A0X1KN56_9EURY|nr:hypothetical protein X802_04875 [Thermococcus guaymasensis DSM 11113]